MNITPKKTLSAAIGAGSLALEKARQLPQQIAQVPQTLRSRDITIAPVRVDTQRIKDLQRQFAPRELPATVRSFGQSSVDRAKGLVDEARDLQRRTSKRAEKLYQDLAKRGEKVRGRTKRSAATKRATTQAKTAKTQVKAASTSVQKAASAGADAVADALDKASDSQAAS